SPSTFTPDPCNPDQWQSSPIFPIETAGVYHVYIAQAGLDCNAGDRSPCVFKFENIEVTAREFKIEVNSKNPNCSDGKGSININVYNARQPYKYTLTYNETGTEQYANSNDPDHTFKDLLPGNYFLKVESEDGCVDTKEITIIAPPEMKLTAIKQDIACDDGTVTLSVEGGTPTYDYAIYSYTPTGDATKLAISPEDPKEYIDENVFKIAPGEEGV